MAGSDKIFLLQSGDLLAMAEEPYDSEAVLQGFLADYPDLLAGSQVNPDEPRRWLLVDRELGVPGELGGADRWAVDHLFIDQDATPTLVEVKRSTNTQIRREVVGQLLDYAANAVRFWPVERLRATVEEKRPNDLAEVLGEDGDPEVFWAAVASNLEAGHLRLMIVADRLPDELVRIIEYLNDQMPDTEVAGVEVGQYVHGNTRVFPAWWGSPPHSVSGEPR